MKRNIEVERVISIAIFMLGVFTFLGADSFKDFYFEIKARSSGEFIDYAKLSEFCGWTGQPLPGESRFAYGLRSAWNMLRAMMAITVVAAVAVGSVTGIIFGLFYWRGSFKK